MGEDEPRRAVEIRARCLGRPGAAAADTAGAPAGRLPDRPRATADGDHPQRVEMERRGQVTLVRRRCEPAWEREHPVAGLVRCAVATPGGCVRARSRWTSSGVSRRAAGRPQAFSPVRSGGRRGDVRQLLAEVRGTNAWPGALPTGERPAVHRANARAKRPRGMGYLTIERSQAGRRAAKSWPVQVWSGLVLPVHGSTPVLYRQAQHRVSDPSTSLPNRVIDPLARFQTEHYLLRPHSRCSQPVAAATAPTVRAASRRSGAEPLGQRAWRGRRQRSDM
jgi:hypothetical protein